VKRAIDAGAGTGFHSLLLARLGVDVTAVDLSGEMLSRVQRHAADMHLTVNTLQGGFARLPERIAGRYDAVFCLGNTLAHLCSRDELDASLRAFRTVLRPDGLLMVQLLNYERILATRERIQNIRETDGTTFIRFYDYHADLVDFNILTIRRIGSGLAHALETVRLRPYVRGDLFPALAHAGFDRLSAYGSIALEEYESESRNLVLVARVPGDAA
jgi:SAM-dependent methyltransferase